LNGLVRGIGGFCVVVAVKVFEIQGIVSRERPWMCFQLRRESQEKADGVAPVGFFLG
jgi:hypothetical protein